ncbi:elongation factor EF-2 [archaeon]|nr:elongation factor EF-2 [archaeon]MBT4021832.1 elongation factor EF-2 [archaeon]MBT4272127.1 elongation factor EF-2 [archaeon]MBT4460308.1 elongation factor EF-2 [archaeon]MBT4858932.1 elongation factor EF-2 [archaeon]
MVDRVKSIMNKPTNIRNIAICAHIDHGKTTFSDNLLAGAGMMSEDLAGKAQVLDFHDDEAERGITIDTSAVSMVHTVKGAEYLINLLDTPGHVDFGGDVTRAMRAADGCIVLVCAVEGMMPQTETVLRQALKERVKPILMINKVDRLIKELQLGPAQMQERFTKIITGVNAYIDKITPPEFKGRWNVSVNDGSVCFGSAFHNWALSVPFMTKSNVKFDVVAEAYNSQDQDALKILRKQAPIHEVILDAVVKHLPNPVVAQPYRIPKIWQGDPETQYGKDLIACNADGKLGFVITKVVVDPLAGEICTGRLFSGTVSKGQEVHLASANEDARIQQVYIFNGAKREVVDGVPSGNIIGIAGLKNGRAGETVTTDLEAEPFEQIKHLFDPVVTKAVEATKPSDLPKLIDVLRKVGKEDPSIHIEINEETGEHLMSGMGELHLEIIENRIKTEKGLEIKTSSPIVVFRETITKPSGIYEGKSPNKHNKLKFRVEPLDPKIRDAIKSGELPEMRIKKKMPAFLEKLRDLGMDAKEATKVKNIFNGNMLTEETRGQVHMGEVIELINDMFEDVMNAGPLAREPCMGVKVILSDMTLHEDSIHRGPAQMYPAIRNGIREAMMDGKPLILEPIQIMQFDTPTRFMGEVSKLLSAKRGQMLDMDSGDEFTTIKGKLPVAESFGLSNDVRSGTEGRASFAVMDQSFEVLPGELQQKIISQIRQRKGIVEEEVTE